jgi:hypothetical protein
MKRFLLAVAGLLTFAEVNAQNQDTVIINLAKTSKIIFTVDDPEDLEILKHYDFQMLFDDILKKVEEKKKGSVALSDSTQTAQQTNPSAEGEVIPEGSEENPDNAGDTTQSGDAGDGDDVKKDDDGDYGHYEDDDDDDGDHYDHHHHNGDDRWNRTWQAFNFDLGMNNYLTDWKFPSDNEAYAIRPWGSWYFGAASVQRTRLAKKFFLEWALGINWYTFKFQDDNAFIRSQESGVEFGFDQRELDFTKSKLTITSLHASLIPVVDFSDHGRKPRIWDGYDNGFRIGLGPYIGYRIDSYSKVVYKDDDGKEKEKDHDGFFLNNFRYGLRLQVGYRSTDLFFNYDFNELFQEGKGPELNAFSFGVIF